MRSAPLAFWLLAVASLGLIGNGMWMEQTAPLTAGEVRFELRMLQGQIRLAEGHWMLATESDLERHAWPERLDIMAQAKQRATAADSDIVPVAEQEYAAALWLILRLTPIQFDDAPTNTDESSTDDGSASPAPRLSSDSKAPRPKLTDDELVSFEAMLPSEEAQTALGMNLRRLARGEPIDRVELNKADTTLWLRRRLDAQSRVPNAPLSEASGLLAAERSHMNRAILLQTGIALMSVVGLLLIVVFAVVRPKPALRSELTSPWASEWWVGWAIPIAWFLAYQLISLVVVQVVSLLDISDRLPTGLQLFAQLTSLAFAVALMRHYTVGPTSIRGVFASLRVGLHALDGRALRAIGWGFALLAIASPTIMLVSQLTELLPVRTRVHAAILEVLESTNSSGSSLAELSLLITVTISAPFCEEIIFRGFMFRQIRGRFGVAIGALASGFAFAAVHGTLASLLPLFMLGVLLALVVEWSGGVLPAMVAHGLWNLYQLLVPLVILAP